MNSFRSERIQDIHSNIIPRFGGIFLIVPFIVSILIWFSFCRDSRLILLAVLSSVILIFGLLDDKYDFNALIQFAFQIILAGAVVFFGINVSYITNPFGGLIRLGIFASIFTVIWIFAIINVINWIDGIDGLASSISLVGMITLFTLSLLPRVNQPFTAVLAGIIAIALVIFLFFNFPPAKIFLGTSGSMFLGFMLAIISIISGGKLATALLVLGIPVLDALWVIFSRLQAGKSIFMADKNHLHHRLLKSGLSQKKIVLILSSFSLIFGIFSIFAQTMGKFILIICLPLTFLGILIYFS